ncbi:MAG: hypothetical protein D6696_01100, partial [Acidobacteria bacterium]
MTYLGNASLAPEVQERIARSFQQTLELIDQGNEREAKLGCEFILGMDPLFQPASTLLERLNDARRPIAVDDLKADAAAPSPSPRVAGEETELDADLVAPGSDLAALDDDELEAVDATPLIPPDPELEAVDATPLIPP